MNRCFKSFLILPSWMSPMYNLCVLGFGPSMLSNKIDLLIKKVLVD
jgi:hypothetical protein